MKPTIMLVDDSPAIIELVRSILGDADYEFITATNGREALALLNGEATPDLMLLDIMMPEMDGVTLCQHIRELEKTKETPIIMLTARKNINSKIDSFVKGANEYITKPFNGSILEKRVSTLLKRQNNSFDD